MKRVNITLPPETLQLIDRLAKRGNRSRLIDQAIHFYIKQISRAYLKKRLQEGAVKRASRDLKLADDWFVLESETWPKSTK